MARESTDAARGARGEVHTRSGSEIRASAREVGLRAGPDSQASCSFATVAPVPPPHNPRQNLAGKASLQRTLLLSAMFAVRKACGAFRPLALRTSHHFHTSAAVGAKRTVSDLKIAGSEIEGYDSLEDECLDDDGSLDTSSAGHIRLQQQRRVLYYWRLIEHEMPNLVGEFSQSVEYFFKL